MRIPDWLRPPRHLLALFLVLMLVPTGSLVWLGWQTLQQDQALERQRLQDRLDAETSRLVVDLARELDTIDRSLPRWLAAPPQGVLGAGALAVRLDAGGVTARAGEPLVFEPRPVAAPDPPEATWQAGEILEMQRQDPAAAIRVYAALAESTDARIRAGAEIRLARALRKAGRPDEALAAYQALASTSGVSVLGGPADLLARAWSWRLLGDIGRTADRDREAAALVADLLAGRWQLDRATYLSHLDSLGPLEGEVAADEAERRALADAVGGVWDQWLSAPRDPASHGQRIVWSGDCGVLVSWRAEDDSIAVFAAGPAYVDRELGRTWRERALTVSLADRDGRLITGPKPAEHGAAVTRATVDTTLPWTLRVWGLATPGERDAMVSRRQVLMSALGLVVFLVLTGAFIVARAVRRDLSVARLQTDFVAAVSHEFRTPLTSMGHMIDLLRSDMPMTDARKREYYEVLARDNERLRRFVETLLDFGRIQSGAIRLELEPVAPSVLVGAVVDEFRKDAAAGQHPITFSANEPMPEVRADRDAFSHALWNLLDNAAKYSPAESPIDVALGRDDTRVLVHVRDRGPGVPPGDRQRIFRRFVRGDGAASAGVKGTGVGLAMVDEIVRAHGGAVRLESELGRGSTFTIALPGARGEGG